MFWFPIEVALCAGCGQVVAVATGDSHQCDPERFVARQMVRFRDGWSAWQESPEGRFEAFYAERQRG